MALSEIVNVSISLDTAVTTSAGFGTSLFISSHSRFQERVRSYTSISSVEDDFISTDPAYIAAQSAFSQTPSPAVVKIGRRDSVTTLTPINVADGTVYNVTVTVNDGDSVTATYTAGALDDEEAVVTDLASDINGDAPVFAHVTATVVGTGASAVLEIAADTSADTFAVTDEENLTITNTSTEAAADVLGAIEDVDNDFYFVAAEDHTEAFVLAMAAAVEAREKIYFVSVAEAGAYAALVNPATDILGKLFDGGYFRTSGWYHHLADTNFPEMAFIAAVSPSTPGTKVWGNTRVAGFGPSQRVGTTGDLTFTEKTNVDSRNANFVSRVAGSNIMRTGKVAANEWIDVIRNRDYYKARLTEALQAKLISSPVIPYSDSGINEIRSVFNSVSDRLVSTETQPNILQETNPYTSNFPRRADVPLVDAQNRVLNASFQAFLAGAILVTNIEGSLTYEGQ